ncbi:plasma membrane channel protein [Colletotrichum kahawae]|uniref:Plasma membrane channel protein n=1 Tax=Colletotrichum kahawae TaxID=34407 RepID=A0AAD9YAE9_COLKA|nr:plasma membrane channel protein [Colletotrichum kahawae]
MGIMDKLARVMTDPIHRMPRKPQTYNDKYVVAYDFSEIDSETAVKELTTLLNDLEQAGLQTEVRAGYEQTLLIFVKAPRELLGNTVYKSRVKDWLYGIVPDHPGGSNTTVVDGAYEAEDILSVYHLVNWPKSLGGAGITPETGQWKNVKSIFPLHNEETNESLLKHLSKRLFLTMDDLDSIRDLWGSKVAFYFAFIQTYLVFLSFPAITGVIAWMYLDKYSLTYAIATCVWCTVFLEYWKIQEVDLGIRWNVQGIGKVKVNRPQFKYDKIIIDETGQQKHYFPKWKQVTRQLLQIPFILFSAVALGTIIILVFAIEVLISEGYDGPYKNLMEYVPTCLLAIALPYISSGLEEVATILTKYENHRTADYHEVSLTQKIFVLNIITNYLPILITAFIYVPFGDDVVPWLEGMTKSFLGAIGQKYMDDDLTFHVDSDRLRDEVIALVVTGQISGFFDENIMPVPKHKAQGLYRDYKRAHSKDAMLLSIVKDDPDEARFLRTARNQATLDKYNVQDDIAEIVLQFGYLSLFSPVWPLIPIGFLVNNVIELRTDFLKICNEFQRPAPVRTDGIGPWINSLDVLTWAGSISTGAIVHLFGANTIGRGAWWALPITIFISEHIFLGLRAVVKFVLQRIGSEQIRKQRQQRYATRVKHLEELEANKQAGLMLSVAERERRKSIRVMGHESFWTSQADDGASAAAGIGLIQAVKRAEVNNKQPKVD